MTAKPGLNPARPPLPKMPAQAEATPYKSDRNGKSHTFRTIARLIAEEIRNGVYQPGDRLPTHRLLAEKMGVAVPTVSRAYVELSRIGLTSGEVGRGTFVRRAPAPKPVDTIQNAVPGVEVDLSINQPAISELHDNAIRIALEQLTRTEARGLRYELAGYQPSAGRAEHREAGAKWLKTFGVQVDSDQIVLSSGIQQGVMVSIAATFRHGDIIIVENLTNPSIRSLASLFRLTLVGVAMDHEGIIPDALDRLARETGAKGLYTIPTFQNPTGTIMSRQRRAEIVEVALSRNLTVIENAAYDALLPTPLPPLAPDISARGGTAFYISGLTKVVMAGVRIAFVVPPPALLSQVAGVIFATTTLVPPLAAEIACQWILDGTAEALAQWQRKEASARHAIAREALGSLFESNSPPCNHFWLKVPEPWRADEILCLCKAQGVVLGTPEAFVVGRSQAPQAIRISLGAARDRETLKAAMDVLSNVIQGAPILPSGFT